LSPGAATNPANRPAKPAIGGKRAEFEPTAVPADNTLAIDAARPDSKPAPPEAPGSQQTAPQTANSQRAQPNPAAAAEAGVTTGFNTERTAPTETPVKVARTGWLAVTAEPSAEVYIDGRYVTDAPAARIELPSGSHTLECKSPRHEPYRETIKITAGELSTRSIVLRRLSGRVNLSTTEGAEVYVDGALKGTTPLSGPIELDVGQHQITVKKAGYHVWNNVVTLEAAQILPLKITLSPIY
jgi:hypothetical protein